MNDIPKGRTKDDIKVREKLIKDFFAHWISEHPDKKVWNHDLGTFIYVKFLSINETYEKAARDYNSTLAVFHLTEILEKSKVKAPSSDSDKEDLFSRITLEIFLFR